MQGFDVSPKAIQIANKNKAALNLNAHFEARDLNSLSNIHADLSVDSSLLHCLVDQDHRTHFYSLCSGLTFIHTMTESDDMSEVRDDAYFTLKDGVLWSTGPERWKMDWHEVDGRPMFKHRRILKERELIEEIKANGHQVLEYEVLPSEKSTNTFIGWIKKEN